MKWEYKNISLRGGAREHEAILNAQGSEGWELVCVYKSVFADIGHLAVFKRSLRDTSKGTGPK